MAASASAPVPPAPPDRATGSDVMLPSPRPTPPCCWSRSALLSLANTRVLFPTARGQTLWEDTWNETPQHHIEQVESGKEPAANHSETNLHFSLPLLHGSRLFTCSRQQVSQEGALILLQAQHPCLPVAVSRGNVASKVGQECAPASVPGDPETPPRALWHLKFGFRVAHVA